MASTRLDGKQKDMLQLRFDVLDTYVKSAAVAVSSWFEGDRLVIVDLTDAFVDRKYSDQFIVQASNVYQVLLLRPSTNIVLGLYTSYIRPNWCLPPVGLRGFLVSPFARLTTAGPIIFGSTPAT